MKYFFKAAKIILLLCAGLFFILTFVTPPALVFAIIALVLALVIKPEKFAQITADEKSRNNTNKTTSGSSKLSGKRKTTSCQSAPPDYVIRDKGDDILRNTPEPIPGLGFANLPEYTVKGIKKSTNRVNTRYVRAASESAAKELIIKAGELTEPIQVALTEFSPALSLDLDYGLKIPDGASRWDSMLFESCVLAKDTKHIPRPFMEYATSLGVPLSWLAGRDYAASRVFERVEPKEKVILYGYAVHCSLQGRLPGNVNKEPMRLIYAGFAEAATRDLRSYESIIKRPGSDMWAPSKNTNAYRFAEAYFTQS